MKIYLSRVLFLIGSTVILFINIDVIANDISNSVEGRIANLELSLGGRIGVSAIDTGNNQIIQYRATERFPLCSTSKLMTVAAILKESVGDDSILKKYITYNQKDLEVNGYSPIAKEYLTTGMNVADLCQAALNYSDNTAMNLLLKQLGGPKVVTAYARSIGDDKFILSRYEPELNTSIPGDSRDTSTPEATVKSLQKIVLCNSSQCQQLQNWLKNNTTGNARIKSGVSKIWPQAWSRGWSIGDKTGTGHYGTANDIGVIWPAKCPPIVLAIYTTQNKPDADAREDIIASVASVIISEFSKNDRCLEVR